MSMPEPSKAELEASHWVVLLDSNEASADDIAQFRAWLGENEEHQRAYAAVSRTADAIDAALRTGGFADDEDIIRPARWRRPALAGAFAVAAILVVFLIALPFVPDGAFDGSGETIEIAHGATQRLELGDGSSAELSPGSRMRSDFSEDERRVVLEKGVGLFDVAEDGRPFIVSTRFGEFRVLGTEFVVRIDRGAATAIVLSGVVEGSAKNLPLAFWAKSDDDHLRASVNQEIRLGGGAAQVSNLVADEVARRLVWREGMVALDGQTLREAAAEVTLFSGVRFQFADRATAETRLSGYVRGSDVAAFTRLLDEHVGIEAEERAPDRILLRLREGARSTR